MLNDKGCDITGWNQTTLFFCGFSMMLKGSFSFFLCILIVPSLCWARLPDYDACPNPNMGTAPLYKVTGPIFATTLNSRPKPCVRNKKCPWGQPSYLKGGELVLAHSHRDFEKINQAYDFYCVYYVKGKKVYSGFLPNEALDQVSDPEINLADWQGQWASQYNATLGIHFNGANFDLLGNSYDVVAPDHPEYINFVGYGDLIDTTQKNRPKIEAIPHDLTQDCRMTISMRGPYLFVEGNGKCNGSRAKLTGTFHKIGPAPQSLGPK
ncbi:MAG: hypothetical protein QNL04_09520 [SAR324 cluster bacterium]|nr:hypothetical protein [SAR324 cluster bacterium]